MNVNTSPLEVQDFTSAATTLRPNRRVAAVSLKPRIHRNSVHRSPGAEQREKKPPTLAAHNPNQESINRLTTYQNVLDSRLSQPKLQSPVRVPTLSKRGSVQSIRRSIEPISALAPNSATKKAFTTVKLVN